MDTPSIWPPTYCLAEDFVSERNTTGHNKLGVIFLDYSKGIARPVCPVI
jgi:hypothetical protein